MSYLSNFTQSLQTELFNSTGAFFAFSQNNSMKPNKMASNILHLVVE